MRVLIANAYVRENGGDAALLSVCIQQVRAAFPGARIEISGMESPVVHATFDGETVIGSVRRFVADLDIPRSRRLIRGAASLAGLGVYLAAPRPARAFLRRRLRGELAGEVQAAATSDLVVTMGGGYMYARAGLAGYQNLLFVLLPLAIAEREGVPLACAPQSYGPFATGLQRRLVRLVLERAILVLAREEISVEHLTEAGLAPERIVRAADAGFSFRSEETSTLRADLGVDRSDLLIGMTARAWMDPEAQTAYERALAATIDHLQESGRARVVLIPQVTTNDLTDDDRIVQRRIAGFCRTEPFQVETLRDHYELKAMYGELDMLVGTRFHSVIFALTAGVPCVGIAYEHKTRGIMRELGLEQWVIDIESVTADDLIPLVDRALDGADGYRAELAERMPPYIARADEVVGMLAEAYARASPVGIDREEPGGRRYAVRLRRR
jgi:colanic acid/amylovoran biosynthesis protein